MLSPTLFKNVKKKKEKKMFKLCTSEKKKYNFGGTVFRLNDDKNLFKTVYIFREYMNRSWFMKDHAC